MPDDITQIVYLKENAFLFYFFPSSIHSGSSVGSRRRSHSRDTVDTNISSTTTGTTRSRKNSDRSAASDKNWRDRAPQYEHSR